MGNLFGGPQLTKLAISASADEVAQGGSVTLTVKGFDQNNKEMTVSNPKWSLDDTSKGSLSGSGATVTFTAGASATGKVKISVTAGGKSASIEITIVAAEPPGGDDEPGEEPGEEPDGGDEPGEPSCCEGLPIIEELTAANNNEFFSAAYKHLPGDDEQPLYVRTGGTIVVSNGKLELQSARFTIGMPQAKKDIETSTEDEPGGTLDLSKPYRITIEVESVGGNVEGKFQVYVDNNTTSAGKSIHGSASKIYEQAVKDVSIGTLVIEESLGTPNSFLQMRTESGAYITITGFKIEYLEE